MYMLSALDDDVILNKCRENGAMGVMLKPLDIKAAQRCLSSVLPAFSPRRRPTVEKSGEAASADMASTSVSSPSGASSKSSNVSSSTATSALQHDAGSAAAKKHRVLIVDDSFISSRIAQRCLQSNDYACETAKNGLEAIRTLRDTERGAHLLLCGNLLSSHFSINFFVSFFVERCAQSFLRLFLISTCRY